MTKPATDLLDVAVIGGGVAGLNAALMLARSRRSVAVIDAGDPRNAPAGGVHGLIGNEGIPPLELVERGRDEVRSYGGTIVTGQLASARAEEPQPDGDLRFTLDLADGRTLTARRIIIATGVHDQLPDIPGLAAHWGRSVVHCPYCHGWEVRDQAIGVISSGAASEHQVLLFRQLSDDIVYFTQGADVSEETRAKFAARGVRIVDEPVVEVLGDADGISGVRLESGQVIERAVLAVSTTLTPRLEGLGGLGLPLAELPMGIGSHIATGMGGSTEVPGVWAAGNVAEPMAQVGASAAGGALAGAHLNATLVAVEADAALSARG